MGHHYLSILNQLKQKSQKSLSDENLLWICSLIEQYKPKRILEVGVSTGGSTAVYLNCIKQLGLACELVSIDSEEFASYKEGKPKIGTEVYELAESLCLDHFQLITGKVVADVVDRIGIFDMIILDTIHFVPGEVLDLLCLKNNMHQGTIVVLDDIHIESRYPNIYPENLNSCSSNPMILSAIEGTLLFPNSSLAEIGGVILKNSSIDENRLLLCLCHKWNSDILSVQNPYFRTIRALYGEEFFTRFLTIYDTYKYSSFHTDEGGSL